jgi:hypothetical protein
MTVADCGGSVPNGTRVTMATGRGHDQGTYGLAVGTSVKHGVTFVDVVWIGASVRNNGGYLPENLEVLDPVSICAQCEKPKPSDNDYLCWECRNDSSA